MVDHQIGCLVVHDQGADVRGIISVGNLVNAVRCDAELENRYLHDYIAGVVA